MWCGKNCAYFSVVCGQSMQIDLGTPHQVKLEKINALNTLQFRCLPLRCPWSIHFACGFLLHPSGDQQQDKLPRLHFLAYKCRLHWRRRSAEALRVTKCEKRSTQFTFHHSRVLLFHISGGELLMHCMQSLVIKLTIGDALCISDRVQELRWWFSLLQANLTESETFFSCKPSPQRTDSHGKQITRIIKTLKEVLSWYFAK